MIACELHVGRCLILTIPDSDVLDEPAFPTSNRYDKVIDEDPLGLPPRLRLEAGMTPRCRMQAFVREEGPWDAQPVLATELDEEITISIISGHTVGPTVRVVLLIVGPHFGIKVAACDDEGMWVLFCEVGIEVR